MKTFIVICSFALSFTVLCHGEEIKPFEPYREGEVRSALLQNARAQEGLDKHEIVRQEFFVGEMKKALDAVKISNTAIQVCFYEDEAVSTVRPYVLPKFMTRVNAYMIRIRRSDLLGNSELVLSHMAYYVMCGIRNSDPSLTPLGVSGDLGVDEGEKARRAEYSVYKTVGWEKYKEFILASFDPDSQKTDSAKAAFLREHQQYLGIWDKDSKDGKPLEAK